MKIIATILAVLLSATHLGAEIRLYAWQESHEEKTGEKLLGFLLAPKAVADAVEADAKGDSKPLKALANRPPEDAWNYGIMLKGEATIYTKEKLALFEPSPCGSPLKVDSGTVEVDRKAGTVRVALKVFQDGKLGEFRGNGSYPIRK